MDSSPIEGLSAAANTLLVSRENAYARLVVRDVPHSGDDLRRKLAVLKPADVIAAPIRSTEHAEAALAGLWLWHDFLDESHTISQGIGSATGSFWHAIMHRREGDFFNSKYWYARCRRHPVLEELSQAERFDPDGFVDRVARVHDKPEDPRYADAVRLQRLEWETLFRHCVHAAMQA